MSNEDPNRQVASGSSGLPWKFVGLLLVVIGLVIFFFQNDQETQIGFLWIDVSWPMWTVIGISVLIGIALDRLGTWQWRRSRARRNEDR